MKIETKAIHSGDRKADPSKPGSFVPVTTPIYTAATYLYQSTAQLDRVLGREEEGYCYSRYDNPTNAALEELKTSLAVIAARDPIPIHVKDLGVFVNPRKPRIFWCGVDAPGLARCSTTPKTPPGLSARKTLVRTVSNVPPCTQPWMLRNVSTMSRD